MEVSVETELAEGAQEAAAEGRKVELALQRGEGGKQGRQAGAELSERSPFPFVFRSPLFGILDLVGAGRTASGGVEFTFQVGAAAVHSLQPAVAAGVNAQGARPAFQEFGVQSAALASSIEGEAHPGEAEQAQQGGTGIAIQNGVDHGQDTGHDRGSGQGQAARQVVGQAVPGEDLPDQGGVGSEVAEADADPMQRDAVRPLQEADAAGDLLHLGEAIGAGEQVEGRGKGGGGAGEEVGFQQGEGGGVEIRLKVDGRRSRLPQEVEGLLDVGEEAGAIRNEVEERAGFGQEWEESVENGIQKRGKVVETGEQQEIDLGEAAAESRRVQVRVDGAQNVAVVGPLRTQAKTVLAKEGQELVPLGPFETGKMAEIGFELFRGETECFKLPDKVGQGLGQAAEQLGALLAEVGKGRSQLAEGILDEQAASEGREPGPAVRTEAIEGPDEILQAEDEGAGHQLGGGFGEQTSAQLNCLPAGGKEIDEGTAPSSEGVVPFFKGVVPFFKGVVPFFKGVVPFFKRGAPSSVDPLQTASVEQIPLVGVGGAVDEGEFTHEWSWRRIPAGCPPGCGPVQSDTSM